MAKILADIKKGIKGQGFIDFLCSTFSLLSLFTTFYLSWIGVCGLLNAKFPILVVLSDSMYPTFKKGDILILSNNQASGPIVGDICVFRLENRDIPIVHRVVERREYSEANDKSTLYLTKGDNNDFDDRALYPSGMTYLNHEQILGKIVGIVPNIGALTLSISEHRTIKLLSLGLFAFFIMS